MDRPTPGPWGWVYSDATCSRPIALQGADEDVILCSEDYDGPRGYISPANARLLEATPSLLAACEMALGRLDYLRQLWGDEGITRSVADALRNAVARATGQDPA